MNGSMVIVVVSMLCDNCSVLNYPRLFLSLGSTLFNAPLEIATKRCEKVSSLLRPVDRLVVSQDGWTKEKQENVRDAYAGKEFQEFIRAYVRKIHNIIGLELSIEQAWSIENQIDEKSHSFSLTARKTLLYDEYGSKKKSQEARSMWFLDRGNPARNNSMI
jgi:hypothetical protein